VTLVEGVVPEICPCHMPTFKYRHQVHLQNVQALEEILHIICFPLCSFNVFPGHGWDISIREMAVAVIKLEILSAAPNSEVSMEHEKCNQ